MSFFAEKSKNLLNLQEESDDEFGGLERYQYTSDEEEESPAIESTTRDEIQENAKSSDFAVPTMGLIQKKRLSTTPLEALPSKRTNAEKTVPSSTKTPVRPAEPRKLQFARIDFKAQDKRSMSPNASIGGAQTIDSDSPSHVKPKSKENVGSSSVCAAAHTEAPPLKVARVSPTQPTAASAEASAPVSSASPPVRVVSQQFNSAEVFSSGVNILSECSKAQARVLAIKKGVDDMTAMYKDTIRGRLIRDREEYALLATRILEEDPIDEIVDGLLEIEQLINETRNLMASLDV